ncbi:MAG: exodeoxyribonuclease V subunit alpha, partial [Actinobacteria bacterium]|nr:exodeoxyribonuclease V subunit alpha [Actinomycetota bacterium]
ARIIALLDEQAAASGAPAPLVALAAPTGKAAARLAEAVHEQAAKPDLDIGDEARTRLGAMEAVTLHRLLGWRPGTRSRFKHDRANRLPHDVVIVDETSMVSLSLMAKLVEAVRANARLILVGDPQQLSSVEAGAVLGDVVGPAANRLLVGEPENTTFGDGIVILTAVHRFKKGAGIATLAEAIRHGDADEVVATLSKGAGDLTWIDGDIAEPAALAALKPVQEAAVTAGRHVTEAARTGAGKEALEALGSFRLLCAHRRGPYGVAAWTQRVERWLAAGVENFADSGTWYVGRPLLISENDYALRLYNGDTGVVVETNGRLAAVFERSGQLLQLSPNRLSAVDTVYAMTIHKSQGSQFHTVAVLLPDPTSRILTRELLYTAVTRAQTRLILAGTEEAIRAAIERPIARASGLRDLLWGGSPNG